MRYGSITLEFLDVRIRLSRYSAENVIHQTRIVITDTRRFSAHVLTKSYEMAVLYDHTTSWMKICTAKSMAKSIQGKRLRASVQIRRRIIVGLDAWGHPASPRSSRSGHDIY